MSKARVINNLLIESVQKYLSHLKQFGMDDKEQRNQIVTILVPLIPISEMTAKCFMGTVGISRRMFDRVKEKKLEFYNICQLELVKYVELEQAKHVIDDDDKSTDSSNDSESDEEEGQSSEEEYEDEDQSPTGLTSFGIISTRTAQDLPSSSSSSSCITIINNIKDNFFQ